MRAQAIQKQDESRRSCIVGTLIRSPFNPDLDTPRKRLEKVLARALESTSALSCAAAISDRRNPRYADGMPETRVERIIFGVGALAVAALVALIVLEMTDRFATRQTQAATRQAATPAATTTVESTTASETMAETTATPEPPRTPSGITLRLKAIADTWVEIRAGSADGDVLYSGILPQGNAKRFTSTQSVGIVRCRLESHSALERKAAAASDRYLQRSRRHTRPEATRRLGQLPSQGSLTLTTWAQTHSGTSDTHASAGSPGSRRPRGRPSAPRRTCVSWGSRWKNARRSRLRKR